MRTLAFIVAGSTAALVFAAAPAYADGGPHQKTSVNSGDTATWGGVTKCASCHRAHTAQGAMLLKTDQESLCLTCHSSSGAANNVKNGVDNYTGDSLRGGGFVNAKIDADTASATYYTSTRGVSLQTGLITTTGALKPTTSEHGLGSTGAFGYLGDSKGTTVTALSSALECGSCHDPHGNGNYRILKPLPSGVSNLTLTVGSASVKTVTGVSTVTVTTTTQHWFGAGGTVKVTGLGSAYDGSFNISSVPSYTQFTYVLPTATTDPDGAITFASATAVNPGTTIADVPKTTARKYTTTNYWLVNDEDTPAGTYAGTKNVSAFIGNIAAWCTQCHTRYMTGPGQTYANSSGDTVFTYRHRGNSVRPNDYTWGSVGHVTNQVNTPNCIQCHVAHGTSATAVDASLGVMYPGTTTPESSSLLRVSNRGVCQMCHNK